MKGEEARQRRAHQSAVIISHRISRGDEGFQLILDEVEKGDGATVVLIPQRVEGVSLGQTVVCGAGGSFELSEVSPGDYYIAAFDHMDGLTPSAAMPK